MRGVVNNSVTPLESRLYNPYGFTGEPTDGNALLYLRARYYAPSLGTFTALDPLWTPNRYAYVGGNPINGAVGELLSLNGYAYVNGNPVNLVDPSGMIAESPARWDACYFQQGNTQLTTSIPSDVLLGFGGGQLDRVRREANRICNELCGLLTADDYNGLDEHCKDQLNTTICGLLCGGEKGRAVMNEAYKGLFQRWIEYFQNLDRRSGQDRRDHRDTYQRVQDRFNTEYNSWWDDCGLFETGLPAEVTEFNQAAQTWKRQPLQSSVPEICIFDGCYPIPFFYYLYPIA